MTPSFIDAFFIRGTDLGIRVGLRNPVPNLSPWALTTFIDHISCEMWEVFFRWILFSVKKSKSGRLGP